MVNILNSGKPLIVRPELAQIIGLNEAIFLHQLHFWLERSNHHYDGHIWVYNTVEQWQAQFPFWSQSTIRRTINSLKEQGLIYTTDKYNRIGTDRRLWYTIDYEKLSAISPQLSDTSNQQPSTSNQQPSTSNQNDQLEVVNVDNLATQDEQSQVVNMSNSDGQDEQVELLKVNNSLYTKNTNKENSIEDQTTTETTEDVVVTDPGAEPSELSSPSECHAPEPALTAADGTRINVDEHGSEKSASIRVDPCPEILTQLQNHGLSQPIALSFAQQYPAEYLQEKISYLEYELDRRPDMTNPAGWLRCAIQQDYAAPPGYYAAQKAAAEKEKWQAILEEHTQQLLAEQETEAEALSEPVELPATNDQLPITNDQPPTTNNQLWEASYNEVAQFMNIGSFLEDLQQSALLSLSDGHATIGVKCKYALERLQRRGRLILRNALTFGLGDLLQGQRATYELVLV